MKKTGKDDWQTCTPEVIKGMVTQSRMESRRHMLKRIGLTSASLFTVIASSMFLWASRKPTREEIRRNMIMPIGCRQVCASLDDFHHEDLDDATSRRIRCHLHGCRPCRKKYHSQFPNAKLSPLSCQTSTNKSL